MLVFRRVRAADTAGAGDRQIDVHVLLLPGGTGGLSGDCLVGLETVEIYEAGEKT